MKTNSFDDKTVISCNNSTKNKTTSSLSNQEEEFSIPINLSEIIDVCRAYSKLGWKIQYQIECIMEFGIDDAIEKKLVDFTALPHIKDFLQQIYTQQYFGDSCFESSDIINMIEIFEEKNQHLIHPKN